MRRNESQPPFAPEFNCDVGVIRGAIARQSLFRLIHIEAVAKVDFVVRKDIPYRREECRQRRHVQNGGHPLWIVSPGDLILSKLAWAKPSRSEIQLRAPDVQARFDELNRQRSGSDRVRMMSDMFDFAKTLELSNLRETYPDASDAELRVLLFDRLYGDEVDPAQRARIVVARPRGERQAV